MAFVDVFPDEVNSASRYGIYCSEELRFYSTSFRPTLSTPKAKVFFGKVEGKHMWNGSLSPLNGQRLLIRIVDEEFGDAFKREVMKFHQFRNENILPISAVTKSTRRWFLVSHVNAELSLKQAIVERDFTIMPFLRTMKELGRLLKYFHSNNFMLNSLNINTILVDEGKPLVYDLSAVTSPNSEAILDLGLLDATAIEPHLNTGLGSDPQSDIFTLGLIMFQAFDKAANFDQERTVIDYVTDLVHGFAQPNASFHEEDFEYDAVPSNLKEILHLAYRCLAGPRSDSGRLQDGLKAIQRVHKFPEDPTRISSRPTATQFVRSISELEEAVTSNTSLGFILKKYKSISQME